MQKRGQVTVFIIVGIIILAVAAGIFYITSLTFEEAGDEAYQEAQIITSHIEVYLESCLEETTKTGLLFIAKQGAYYEPLIYKDFSYLQVPYYSIYGDYYFPELTRVETELANYVEDNFYLCSNLSMFEEQGYNFTQTSYTVTPNIKTNSVDVQLDYPLKISKQSSETTLGILYAEIDTNFQEVHETAESLIELQKNVSNSIPLGDILNSTNETEFQFVTVHLNDDTVLYNLYFESSGLDEPYLYSYLVTYEWDDINQSILDLGFLQPNTNITIENNESNESSEDLIDDTLNFLTGKVTLTKKYLSQTLLVFANGDVPPVDVPVDQTFTDTSYTMPDNWDSSYWNDPTQIATLDVSQFLGSLASDLTLFDNPEVAANFESRLGDPSFITELNGERGVLNGWAEGLGISFGEEGQLSSYSDGLIIPEGEYGVPFDANAVPGATVLGDGSLQLAEGGSVSSDPEAASTSITRDDDGILILEGCDADLTDSEDLGDIKVTGGSVMHGDLEFTSDNEITISFGSNDVPTISGEEILIYDSSGVHYGASEDEPILLTGSMTLDDSHYTFGDDTKVLLDGTSYVSEKEVDYYWESGRCGSNQNCIEKDINTGVMEVSIRDNEVFIWDYDESITHLDVNRIRGSDDQVIFINNEAVFEFTKNPFTVQGRPDTLTTSINQDISSSHSMEINPSDEGGLVLSDCWSKSCRDMGVVSNEILLYMSGFQEAAGTRQAGDVPYNYFDNIGSAEYRVESAIHDAAEANNLDVNYLRSVVMKEGFDQWIFDNLQGGYGEGYLKPGANVGSQSQLGTDAFGVEVDYLIENEYLRQDFRVDGFTVSGDTYENELGDVYPSVSFTNVENAMEAAAAMVEYRHDLVLKDMANLGTDVSQLPQEDIDYWTYVYYNAGAGRGLEKMESRYPEIHVSQEEYFPMEDSFRNAQTVMNYYDQYNGAVSSTPDAAVASLRAHGLIEKEIITVAEVYATAENQ